MPLLAWSKRMPTRLHGGDVHRAAPAAHFVFNLAARVRSMVVTTSIGLGLAGHVSNGVAQPAGIFSPTGNMESPRFYHTATRLADGRVLVVGGTTDQSPEKTSSSAELYDPEKGEFIRTGNMNTARRAHTATYLSTGKVLIAGGCGVHGSLTSAELFDPATGIFTPTGSMNHAQGWHTATLLHNGKVLIAGGITATGPVLPGHAEVYDPNTGSFTAISLNHRLVLPAATLLSNGRVLVSTGRIAEFAGSVPNDYGLNFALIRLSYDSSQLFDPIANTFSALGPIPLHTTYWHTATLLKNGMVLVAGGGDADEGYRSTSALLFDPARQSFSETGQTLGSRMLHTATLLNDGNVLIAGGTESRGELYDASTRTFGLTANMIQDRIGHTATLLGDGRVLIVGGTRNPSGSAEIYRPLLLIPTPTVSGIQFDRTEAVIGGYYTATVNGPNLTAESYIDVRISTGGDTHVVLNWQKGHTFSHPVPANTAPGSWTINGVRAHQEEADHTGDFTPINATIAIVP